MYIEVKLESGETVEFWEVRSWNFSQGLLWIYFKNDILPNNQAVGYLKNCEVLRSFVYSGEAKNASENLELLA